MYVTYEGATVRAMALDEWGADCQKVVRALAECGGRLPFDAMANFLGWQKDRVRAVCVARGRPAAASFGAVFMKIVCGSWWLFLPDRTIDGLPAALRAKLEGARGG
jgi:hypothetical protein